MKKFLAIVVIALALMLATVAAAASSVRTLTVAMHDPGCHSFLVHGKYKTAAKVAGPIRLRNYDEATLKVASRSGVRRVTVGKSILLQHGHYVVMMKGQAPDDNYLKLTVR